ncbi:hypothetical protein HGP16_19280 [Rhizobium sp. P40RR-XXII]|uniref:RHS repeat-associated core domain-containing protein n=1 Tax=Rhizobium sp. P40RR-XXII TaxID=2726739 RepID=UPI0014570219|nr:hypothetical protein [Rhizobium sp. P40RR-XXII]
MIASCSLAWFRAYSSDTGRWLSRDPVGEGTDSVANLYTYVLLDPLYKTDPLGQSYQFVEDCVQCRHKVNFGQLSYGSTS